MNSKLKSYLLLFLRRIPAPRANIWPPKRANPSSGPAEGTWDTPGVIWVTCFSIHSCAVSSAAILFGFGVTVGFIRLLESNWLVSALDLFTTQKSPLSDGSDPCACTRILSTYTFSSSGLKSPALKLIVLLDALYVPGPSTGSIYEGRKSVTITFFRIIFDVFLTLSLKKTSCPAAKRGSEGERLST